MKDPQYDIRSSSRQDNEDRYKHRQHIKIALTDGTDIDLEFDPGTDKQAQSGDKTHQETDDVRATGSNEADQTRTEDSDNTEPQARSEEIRTGTTFTSGNSANTNLSQNQYNN